MWRDRRIIDLLQALHVQYAEQLVTAAALPHAALFVLAHIKNAQWYVRFVGYGSGTVVTVGL